MKDYRTEQEFFWAGKFGDDYISRNMSADILGKKLRFFSQIRPLGNDICSCCEFGPNVGMNLQALRLLFPDIELYGVEINSKAASECAKISGVTVYNKSILDFESDRKWDMTFTSGVLIHIAPEMLSNVYAKLYEYSKRYILIREYYELEPMEINYRGNKGKLFKRDFAGEMLDAYKDLRLVDYGFTYHRDKTDGGEDSNWFLMEKANRVV